MHKQLKKMNKHKAIKYGAIGLVVVSVLGVLRIAQSRSVQANTTPIEEKKFKVKVASVQPEGKDVYLQYTGMIQPAEITQCTFGTVGIIEKLNVKEGDQVSKGQVLATLDTNSADQKQENWALLKDQMNTAVVNAQNSRDEAKREYEKASVGASAEDLNAAREARDAAQSSRDSYREQLSTLNTQIEEQQAAVDQAQAEYDKAAGPVGEAVSAAKEKLKAAQQEQEQTAEAFSNAQQALINAQKAKQEAVDKQAAAAAELAEAESELAKLQEAEQKDEAAIAAAQTRVEAAKQALTEAQATAAQADAAVAEAEKTASKTELISKNAADVAAQAMKELNTVQSESDLDENAVALAKAKADLLQSQTDAGAVQLNLAAAETELAAKKAEYDRLAAKGPDSVEAKLQKQRLDGAENLLDAAQGAQMSAQNGYTSAQEGMDAYTLKAPSDGFVIKVVGNEGGMGAPIAPTVVIGSNQASVQFGVSQNDVRKLQQGGTATVTIGDNEYPGTIASIASTPDVTTRTYMVSVEINADINGLYLGEMAQVKLEAGERSGAWLPLTCVLNDGEDYVYIVENDRAVRRSVRILDVSDDKLLLDGLDAGSSVIIEGMKTVRSGSAVLME